jgi:diketogulonate reductase-like aldo/keto reductase
MPVFGLGTWRMGESGRRRPAELDALKYGLAIGYPMIDTAEMYGEGGAEEVIGEAMAGRRDEVFLVSKVYPHNATRSGTIAACERSLKRLRIDRIDLYLLHWRGAHPLAETVAAFERLQRAGKIRHWGVSNLDREDMAELTAVAGGGACATNQVLYNLGRRGPEWDLLPWCRERDIPVMAYSPLEQGRLAGNAVLGAIAGKRGSGPLQIALAWVLSQPGVLAIPKSSRLAHVEANAAALDIELSPGELAEIDRAFPPPKEPQPLAML